MAAAFNNDFKTFCSIHEWYIIRNPHAVICLGLVKHNLKLIFRICQLDRDGKRQESFTSVICLWPLESSPLLSVLFKIAGKSLWGSPSAVGHDPAGPVPIDALKLSTLTISSTCRVIQQQWLVNTDIEMPLKLYIKFTSDSRNQFVHCKDIYWYKCAPY